MKNRRLIWFVTLMLLVSMTVVACGGGGETEDVEPESAAVENNVGEVEADEPEVQEQENVEEQETEAEPPVEEAVEEVTQEEPEEPKAEEPKTETEEAPAEESSSPIAELLKISEIDTNEGLENYEMDLSMTFTAQDESGNDVTQTILADIIYSTDPTAFSMNMTMDGVEGAEEFGNMSMVQTESTSYVVIPGLGCITSEVEEAAENPFADLADSDQILEGVDNAKFEGEENINGVDTLHYSFDASNLTEEEAQDVEWAEGHIYLAKDGDYMVRFVMEGEGVMDQFSDSGDQFGMMQMEYNITPSTDAAAVEIPAECAEAGAENSAYPILDDATEFSSFGGFISYTTVTSLEDALAFYDEALGADGWTKDAEAGMYLEGSIASYEYTKDDLSISLMISANDGEENNSVLIIEGE